MSKSIENTLHVQITLTMNANSYNWSDPRVEKRINFEMPVDLFHSGTFTKLFDKALEELKSEFPARVAEFEKEQAEKAVMELAEANA